MDNTNRIAEFKAFLKERVGKDKATIEAEEKERIEFIQDYPLERIATLSAEQYCLGTEKSKDSLCYQLEFGKYKHTGFGIGGGSAKKHGVYYSKNEQCYKHGFESIGNIEEFWPQFRDEMFRFLSDSGKAEFPLRVDDYPMLQGMAMVLTKLLCLYFPDKYFSIGSYSVLRELMDLFQYDYTNEMRCNQLNFYFNRNIRTDVPELEKFSGMYIGDVAWAYVDGKPSKQKKTDDSGLGDEDIKEKHYWLYSPGDSASCWDEFYDEGIMAIGWDEIGDLQQYATRAEMKAAMKENIDPALPYTMASLATWQFVHDIRPGDIVFAKKGRTVVVGRGVVESEYEFDETRSQYRNVHKVRWTHRGEWPHPGQAAMKTLTDISAYTDYVAHLNDLFAEESLVEDEEAPEVTYPVYTAEDFLNEVYMA